MFEGAWSFRIADQIMGDSSAGEEGVAPSILAITLQWTS